MEKYKNLSNKKLKYLNDKKKRNIMGFNDSNFC